MSLTGAAAAVAAVAAAAAAAADSRMTLLKEGEDADETAVSPDRSAAALSGYWAKAVARFPAECPGNSADTAAAAAAADADADADAGSNGDEVDFCGAIMNTPLLQNT